jgi:hypothetical protein
MPCHHLGARTVEAGRGSLLSHAAFPQNLLRRRLLNCSDKSDLGLTAILLTPRLILFVFQSLFS